MNNHKNDFNRWPLTVSGLCGRRCCQVIQPHHSNTPVVLVAKGQIRLRAQSVSGSNALKLLMADVPLPGRLDGSGRIRNKTSGKEDLFQLWMLNEYPDLLVMNEIRKRTDNYPVSERLKIANLNSGLDDQDARVGFTEIYSYKMFNQACRTVLYHPKMMILKHCNLGFRCKTPLRWRKNRLSKRLADVITGHDCLEEFRAKKLQPIDLKLILN